MMFPPLLLHRLAISREILTAQTILRVNYFSNGKTGNFPFECTGMKSTEAVDCSLKAYPIQLSISLCLMIQINICDNYARDGRAFI